MFRISAIICLAIMPRVIYAATAAPVSGEVSGRQPFMPTLMFFGFLFVLFYVLFIAPQRKQQRQHETVLKALKPGDRVITKGGMKGIVSSAREENEFLLLKIADNVKIEILRSSIDKKLEDQSPG